MKREIGELGDGVIALRLIEDQDLAATLAWRNRDEARVWFKTSDKISPASHQSWFENYLRKDDDYLFIVEASGRSVGQCAIYGIDLMSGSAEVGRFLAAPDEGGKGYMGRSCALLVRFAADALKLRYLFLEVFANNTRAAKVYAACGFREEGRSGDLIRMGLALGSAA